MKNQQFIIAFDILTGYYGFPQWEEKPKEGQSKEQIVQTWCDELGKYSVDQVRKACFWLTRKKKTMTFPTIAAVLNEIYDEAPMESENESAEIKRCIATLQRLDMEKGNSKPQAIKDLIIGRVIWRNYRKLVLGYRPDEDTGFCSGAIPAYVQKQINPIELEVLAV